jgi:hypothetical protein
MTIRSEQLRLAAKNPVRIATTANIANLATGAPNTVDGVSLAVDDRILVKDQGTGSQNGLYYVTVVGTGSNGTWVRSTDFDSTIQDEIKAGANVYVQEGTLNEKKTFYLTTTGTITLGSTSLTFEVGPTAGAGSIAGTTGSTDDAILRADGTGGGTVQASGITIDDSDNVAGATSLSLTEQASAPVAPGSGSGAFWVGQGTGVNLPYFTDENALDVALVRSVALSRSMPSTSADSVELGSFTNSTCQSFSVVIHTGTSTSNDFVAYHRVIVRNAANTGGFVVVQPLYTSGPLNTTTFGDLIQLEMSVAVGGAISLRARSHLGLAQTVKFRLVLDGDDTGVFTPSSTQATTTSPTTIYQSTKLTQTDAIHSTFGGDGTVSWAPIYFQERAAASGDVAGYGQLWVRNSAPNVLVFTDDAGTDWDLHGNPIDNQTGSYTIPASSSGTTYTNTGATALVSLTLPSAVAGLTYTFIISDTDGIRINANTGDTIRLDASIVSTSGGYVESTSLAGSVVLRAISTSQWMAVGAYQGTWSAA